MVALPGPLGSYDASKDGHVPGTAMLFAARTVGHRVLLYDGSFQDWVVRDLPVENPAAKK